MSDELITAIGIEDVQRMLAEAPKEVVATGFLNAGEAAGTVIEDYVAGRTPEGETGDLLQALTHTTTLDSDLRGVSVEVGFSGKQGHVANWLEYGHRMVGHKPDKKDLGAVEPCPFLRLAADASANEAIEAFGDTLIETLQGRLLGDGS